MKTRTTKSLTKLVIALTYQLIIISSFAQTPEKMNYQAVIRNSGNTLVINQPVGMQISILQGSVNGLAVYVETQTPATNASGLVSVEIGGDAAEIITGNFSTINWANGPYFIKTEIDPTGGTNYTISATGQLLSVPYALHAKTAENISGTITETDTMLWKKNNNDIFYNKGNVGIKTLSPYASLSITADDMWDNLLLTCSVGQPTLRLDDTQDTTSLGYNFRQAGEALYIDRRQNLNTVNSIMGFDYGNKKNISLLPFEINNYSGYASTKPLLRLEHMESPTTDYLQISSSDTLGGNILSIDSSGNVGVGIESPNRSLHLFKSSNSFPFLVQSPNGSSGIEINTPSQYASGGIRHSFGENPVWYNYAFYDYFSFREETGNKEILTLKNNGNVGIGTTDPQASLHIIRPSETTPSNGVLLHLQELGDIPNAPFRMLFQGPVGTGCWYMGGSAAGDFQIIRTCNTTDSTIFHINNWNYNVGIGTASPNSKLQVTEGDVYVETIGKGVILSSPDGNCYKVTVSNGGTLETTLVDCP
jgi:hypothetical protein